MNPNAMGAMPNGMMGMMPNAHMNPQMQRPGHPNMPLSNNGFQTLQSMLYKQMTTADRSTLPPGWQQTHQPGERVKNVSEIFTMLRTMQQSNDIQNMWNIARQLEDRVWRDSPSKEIYDQLMVQRKMQLQQKRQANAGALQQSLQQQNAQMMTPQQQMFAQQNSQQQRMQMAHGVANQFNPQFNGPQTPRPNQMPTPQMGQLGQMQGQMQGQMPAQMQMAAQMGMNQAVGQMPQLSQQDQQQINLLASRMMQQANEQDRSGARQQVMRSMQPRNRMALQNSGTDPAIIYFRERAKKAFMASKMQAAQPTMVNQMGQPPQNMHMQQFNPNMAGPNGNAFNEAQNLEMFRKQQEEAMSQQNAGELVVPPSNQPQRPASAMKPGMQGFPMNGASFINQNQNDISAQARQAQSGQQGGMAGVNGTGSNAGKTPQMQTLNQPFSGSGSPQVPQRPTNGAQNGVQQMQGMRMPTPQEQAQMNLAFQQMPAPARQKLTAQPLQAQWLYYQELIRRQNIGNQRAGLSNQASGNQNQPQPNAQSNGAAGQAAQQQPQPSLTMPPQVEKTMDDMDFPLDQMREKIRNLPAEVRKWGQLKLWLMQNQNSGRFPPAVLMSVKKWQAIHWRGIVKARQQQMNQQHQLQQQQNQQQSSAQQQRHNIQPPAQQQQQNFQQPQQQPQQQQPQSSPSAGQASSATMMTSGANPTGMAMPNIPIPSDESVEQFKAKNPKVRDMPNDEIKKRWMAQKVKYYEDMRKNAAQAQQAASQAESGQPAQGQPKANAQNQNQQTQNQHQPTKPPARQPSSDDVVEVANPNAPKPQAAAQPQPAKQQSQAQNTPARAQQNQQNQQNQRNSKQVPQFSLVPLSAETKNKFTLWKSEAISRLPAAQNVAYSDHQRQSIEGVLVQNFGMLRQIDLMLQVFYQYCDPPRPNKEAEFKQLLQMSILVRKQYDRTDQRMPKVNKQLTIEAKPLAECLIKLKTVAQQACAAADRLVPAGGAAAQPGARNGGAPTQQQYKAPQAPMGESQRKNSMKRPKEDTVPAAPTREDAPSLFPDKKGQGVPEYAPAAKNMELNLPQKRRKANDGTPVPSPPTYSPNPKTKSPRTAVAPAPAEKHLKCKQEGCQNSKATFKSKDDLQKHLDTVHDEKMPDDPLEYALSNARLAWNLDDEGKSKNVTTKMEKSASKQGKATGPGGVPMSRAATGANSNAPRTPQSMSTTGSSSKPATPAMQAGKLPSKQTQAPPTPPQDLWQSCSITAQSVAEVLPTPVPLDSLADLTPDNLTSPEGGDRPADKATASPKTPKAGDPMQLDTIQVKDIGAIDNKTTGIDLSFDFAGGMVPFSSGMYGTSEVLGGGGYGDGLEELFNGDISLNGEESWNDRYLDMQKQGGAAGKDVKKGNGATKTSAKPKPQVEDNWASAFDTAWE